MAAPAQSTQGANRNSSFEYMISSEQRILHATTTLLRLSQIDQSLPQKPEVRQKILNILRDMCKEVLTWTKEGRPEADTFKEKIKFCFLRKLGKLPEPLALSLDATEETIRFCANRILKDIESITTSPLIRAARGFKGPTFLVGYSRNTLLTSYVLKLSERNEVVSSWVYAAFGYGFTETPTHSFGFNTPAGVAFDLVNNTFEVSDEKQIPLEEEFTSSLKTNFDAISKIYFKEDPELVKGKKKEKLHIEPPRLLFTQRVPGENIFDFARSKYIHLDTYQKTKFFVRIGRLTMLDIPLGMTDRHISIDFEKGEYFLTTEPAFKNATPGVINEPGAANLGNTMVVWNKGEEKAPTLSPIDNGIDEELIFNAQHKEAYLRFIDRLFTNPKAFEILATNMAVAFQSDIDSYVEEYCTKNKEETKAQLKAFCEDLKTIAIPAFQKGLEQMSKLLNEVLIPAWENPENKRAVSLKNHLKRQFPEMLSSLEERFKQFKSMRR